MKINESDEEDSLCAFIQLNTGKSTLANYNFLFYYYSDILEMKFYQWAEMVANKASNKGLVLQHEQQF